MMTLKCLIESKAGSEHGIHTSIAIGERASFVFRAGEIISR